MIVKSHSEIVKYRCISFVALSKPPSIWQPGNELNSTLIMFDQNFSQLSGTFKTSVSWNWNDKDSKLRLLQRKAGQQDFRPLSSYVESHITKNSESFSSSKWLHFDCSSYGLWKKWTNKQKKIPPGVIFSKGKIKYFHNNLKITVIVIYSYIILSWGQIW